MKNLIIILIGLSALAFLLASISSYFMGGMIIGLGSEALSRASNNLALIAIALGVWIRVFEK